jgi:serine/threonine protein kinase
VYSPCSIPCCLFVLRDRLTLSWWPSGHQETETRLQREKSAASRGSGHFVYLNHVHIIRLLEVDKAGRIEHFVMSYCPGGDLEGAIRTLSRASKALLHPHRSRMTRAEARLRCALSSAYFVSRYLLYNTIIIPLTAELIVHRVIKPENSSSHCRTLKRVLSNPIVLLMTNGMVRLADFGLSRTLEVSHAVAQSFVGVCLSRQLVYGCIYANCTPQTRGYLAPISTCSDT